MVDGFNLWNLQICDLKQTLYILSSRTISKCFTSAACIKSRAKECEGFISVGVEKPIDVTYLGSVMIVS